MNFAKILQKLQTFSVAYLKVHIANCTSSVVLHKSMDHNDIKTFAFFDLETTGLPALEFNKTKITELSLIACSKEHLLNAPLNQLPRVLHKISLCFNPMKMITPESTRITALDNYLLEKEKSLDINSGNCLLAFLNHLQHPVCLVAHNGNSFDFPILKREFKRLGMVGFITFYNLSTLKHCFFLEFT